MTHCDQVSTLWAVTTLLWSHRFFVLLAIGLTSFATCTSIPISQRDGSPGIFVNLRIEGAVNTIFESLVFSRGHNVTTQSGGTHHCDGTNNHPNPTPGATVTTALNDASDLTHFTWDGYITILFLIIHSSLSHTFNPKHVRHSIR